jgi:hypothetical protein
VSDFDSIRAQLAELEQQLRPIAKARPSWRDEQRSRSHAAFVSAVQALTIAGRSKRSIALSMGVDTHTFEDWLSARRQLPAWVIAALPVEGRVAFMREALSWNHVEPRDGTDG